MKKLLYFICFSCLFLIASAQKLFFIYLESENSTPFYIRVGDKVYSSSAAGYLLLPNLEEQNYTFFLGFPSTGSKELKFNLNIDNRDYGFLIKNSRGDVALQDLQNQRTIKAVEDRAGNITYERRSDSFTALLARASGDSSLLYVPVYAKTETGVKEVKTETAVKKPETSPPRPEQPVDKTEEPSNKTEEPVAGTNLAVKENTGESKKTPADSLEKTAVANVHPEADKKLNDTTTGKPVLRAQPETARDTAAEIQTEIPYTKSNVKKHAESSTTEGYGLVFYDRTPESTDTIRLLIQNPKFDLTAGEVTDGQRSSPTGGIKPDRGDRKVTDTDDTASRQVAREEKPAAKKDTAVSAIKSGVAPPKVACDNPATENDFFRLRKNMAAKQSDEAMVDEAKKSFKSKCYSTEQIRYLSSLFLTSAGKYQFFDAAYMHVSDQDQFPKLRSEIKDEYYLRRFKALIGE